MSKLVIENTKSACDISQNYKRLWFTNCTYFFQKMYSFGDNIKISLAVTHSCSFYAILIKINNTTILRKIGSPFTKRYCLTFITVKNCLMSLNTLHRNIIVKNNTRSLFINFTPIMFFKGGFSLITITH